jgi:uncharacterized membrane protein
VGSGSGGRSLRRRLDTWIGRPFLTREEKARIAAVVSEVEQHTTVRMHVYVKSHTAGKDFLAYARRRFASLGPHKQPEQSDVLILISAFDRRFAIWGGEMLHEKVGQDLWDRARDILTEHLAAGRPAEGIEACVRTVGGELARHFPREQRR